MPAHLPGLVAPRPFDLSLKLLPPYHLRRRGLEVSGNCFVKSDCPMAGFFTDLERSNFYQELRFGSSGTVPLVSKLDHGAPAIPARVASDPPI